MLKIKMCHINNISEIQNIKSNSIVLRTYKSYQEVQWEHNRF